MLQLVLVILLFQQVLQLEQGRHHALVRAGETRRHSKAESIATRAADRRSFEQAANRGRATSQEVSGRSRRARATRVATARGAGAGQLQPLRSKCGAQRAQSLGAPRNSLCASRSRTLTAHVVHLWASSHRLPCTLTGDRPALVGLRLPVGALFGQQHLRAGLGAAATLLRERAHRPRDRHRLLSRPVARNRQFGSLGVSSATNRTG